MAIKGLNRQYEHPQVSSSSPFQHYEQDPQTLPLLDDSSGSSCSIHHIATTEQTNERTTLLQILYAALDEVEVSTGPWHQSIAGLLGYHIQHTSSAVTC